MNLFELFVKVGVDDQASGKLDTLSQKIGNGLKKAAKIGTAAVAMATTAIVGLTSASIKSYAEYEQLIGGAELMFGKAFDTVKKNSQEAYKTVQMSQNEYLQQVNGFATGLKTALGGNEKAAADLAHKIIQAEADIVAATGNTAENVQNAFNGIMKSNFTMLDNLQIGITPTKEGFQEVIDKVNAWNKTNGEATNYQMGNLADMQSALVDYIDMVGMSGYAQDEAAKTITGSLSSMKAAWTNLVTGIADNNADFDTLISQFVESVGTVGKNILPKIEVALNGAVKLISELFPKIAAELPGLIKTLLPSLLSGIVDVIGAIVENLPEIIDSILSILPDLIDQLVEALVELTPKLTEAIVEIVQSIADNLPEIIQSILDAIPVITESVNQAILENFPALLQAIIQIVLTIVQNLPTIIQMLVDQIGPIVSTIVQVIVENAPAFIAGIAQIVFEIVKALPSIMASIGKSILNIFSGIGTGLVKAWPKFKEGLSNIWSKLSDWFAGLWEKTKNLGKNIIDGIKEGIKNAWNNLKTWFKNLFSDLIGIAKKILGIASPSKVFKRLGKWTAEGFGIGFDDEFANVQDDIENALDFNDVNYGITASNTSIGDFSSGTSQYNSSTKQNVVVTVKIDENANAMGFARALLPLLKVAEKEVYA